MHADENTSRRNKGTCGPEQTFSPYVLRMVLASVLPPDIAAETSQDVDTDHTGVDESGRRNDGGAGGLLIPPRSERGDRLFLMGNGARSHRALIAHITSFPVRTPPSDLLSQTILTTHLVGRVGLYKRQADRKAQAE